MKIDATTIIEYTYEEMQEGIEAIASQMAGEDFHPDIIVGVVRGGAIPAVCLSHKLKTPVEMVRWSLRDGTCEINDSIPENLLQGRKLLLVEDIIDGGDTVESLLDEWRNYCGPEFVDASDLIRVAALWFNPSQEITKADYTHRTIDRDVDSRWVIFPWEC